jgi:S-formylglutathione hydrolase
MSELALVGRIKTFGGWIKTYTHSSPSCNCTMRFSIYLPPQADEGPVPVLYWLSGLTCTDENFMVKSGAQRYAAELGIALVAPDTSPRGDEVPDDPEYDLGQGAGFYVNATQAPWSTHYHMYDYVIHELPPLIENHFGFDPRLKSVCGHSMGGHGALIATLKNPGMYRAVSAFAPICAPSHCPWGEKALSHYLGDDRETWKAYDATCLITTAQERLPILIDQGDADEFLQEQLNPELFQRACAEHGHPLTFRIQPGYDHGYEFIGTFFEDHLQHHAKALLG